MRNDKFDDCKQLVDKLGLLATEFDILDRPHNPLNEYWKLNVAVCNDSAEMIKELQTEVYRLRESIGLYQHGRMDSQLLYKISQTWNKDMQVIGKLKS